MKSSQHILLTHFYPAVYGITLLFIVNYVFSEFINSLTRPAKILSLLRFFEILGVIISNVHLVFVILLLMFIEMLRVVIINARALILVEAFLLFVYCWSIEIVLLYLILSYMCLKVVQNLIPGQETSRGSKNLAIDQNNATAPHCVNNTKLPRLDSNIVLIVIGSCIGIHILCSYFISVNLISMMIYISSVIVIINRGLKHYRIKRQIILDILLSIIPPFGIIPVLYRVFFVE